MMRIALTGSIGTGKSTVARMFESFGVPVFDADAVVRRLQETDEELIAAIGRRFPDCVDDRRIDRAALREHVLADPAELAALEALVHPAVAAERERFIAECASDAMLFDIPLLFETGGEADFDKVIVTSVSPDIQRRRVLARPGMTDALLDAILDRQMPDSQKRARADFIVDTAGELSETRAQVRDILTCLGLPAGG